MNEWTHVSKLSLSETKLIYKTERKEKTPQFEETYVLETCCASLSRFKWSSGGFFSK